MGFIDIDMYSVIVHPIHRDPFYQPGLTLIPAWMSDHMHNEVWNQITSPFPTTEFGEWLDNFVPHFKMDAVTYPCRK